MKRQSRRLGGLCVGNRGARPDGILLQAHHIPVSEWVNPGIRNHRKWEKPRMQDYKTAILENICYTDLVYERINKKLNIQLTKNQIENMIYKIIEDTDSANFNKIGKNIYITNKNRNIRLTINSYTNRIITADKLNKQTTK